MVHELLCSCQEYGEETYDEFLQRYNGFGKNIYTLIRTDLPSIFKHLKFYHATKSTEKCVGDHPYLNDSYAIFDDGIQSFQIQLDCDGQVLLVFNFEISIETGHWSDDEYSEILGFINENFVS